MKMLIVDDDPGIVTFFVHVARVSGCDHIDTATSAEQAMAMVVRGSYDLITLDIRMPGASGIEILSLLRNQCPHAVISVISGHVPDDALFDLATCADLVLHKPVNARDVVAIIERTMEIHRSLQDIRQMSAIPLDIEIENMSLSNKM